MANLYTGEINTNGEYSSIESLTGITFENNTKYVIQIQNQVLIREGEDGEGFLINYPIPIQFTKKTDDLYIKTTGAGCVVNIAN